MRSSTMLALTLALLAPSAAIAQAPDVHAVAEEQFKQGRDAMNQGDCKKARELFQSSNAKEPGRGKLLNMAICEEQLGMLAAALQHFQELLPQLPKGDERLPIARRYIAQLDKRVARVKISLAPWVSGDTRVTLDDAPVEPAKLGAELPVDPGKHVISVSQMGRSTRRYEVTIEPLARTPIVVEPGDAESPKGAPEPLREPVVQRASMSVKLKAGIGLLSGFGLVLGAGAFTGGLAIAKHKSAEEACPSHTGCSPEVVRDASTGKALSIASTALLVTGLAGMGVGAVLVVMDQRAKVSARVMPAPLHGGGFIGVHGSF